MADYELNSVLNSLESIELNSTLNELQTINANFVIDYRPEKTSQLINDSGFITNSALDGYATENFVTSQGYITKDVDNLTYYTKTGSLATVAISGSYNDLLNKPSIPSKTSQLTNDSGFITNSALNGYATETWVSNQGYITGINSTDITNALGYTPYDSSNPNGYTSNVGTVTSVNNTQPVNGNVTISIPSEVTETTVSNWGFTKNLGTVTSVNNVTPTNGNVSIAIPTDTNDLTNGAGYITGITGTDVTNALGYTPYNSTNPNNYITNSALSNYVTTNTLQTLSSGKKIFANDAVMAGNQTALLATISNSNTATSDNAWVGRYICGAKNLTFLMGTYRTMAGIGAHSWTNAQTGAGAGWADFYMNPDGDKAVYIGGYGWTKNSGWFKVKNSSNTGGTIQVNKGSISSPSWKDVAYKGENVSDFSFTSISGYNASKTQTLKHINGTLTWVDD